MPGPTQPADPQRWFRTRPDSSILTRPRLLARSLIPLPDLDEHISHYERLLGVPADLRMPIPDFGGLELAAIGNILLIASSRAFTPIQRRTRYSLIVPNLRQQLDLLEATRTTVVELPESILPGARARVRYPDGTLAELVEHRPWPGEQPQIAMPETSPPRPQETGLRLLPRHAVAMVDFPATVRLYEKLLQAPARTTDHLTGPVEAHAATVGDLLIVGLPTTEATEATDHAQPRTALVVSASTSDPTDSTFLPAGQPAAEVWTEKAPTASRPTIHRVSPGESRA